MSRRFEKQYASAGFGVITDGARGITFDCGTTVPTDGAAGYAPGCLFIDDDASGGLNLYINRGTVSSCNFDVFSPALTLTTQAGAGITGGAGTVYKSSVMLSGGIFHTRIMLDLTGLQTSTTDLDIVGSGASAAHLGQITAAQNGTILFGRMSCFKTPATGADDLDLYSATEATGVFDGAVASLTETALLTKGGAWAAGDNTVLTAIPAANEYLYLTNGEAGTVGTFTAGQFLIELFGY